MVITAGGAGGAGGVMGEMVPDICCDFAPATLLSTDPDSAVPGKDYPMTRLPSVKSGVGAVGARGRGSR